VPANGEPAAGAADAGLVAVVRAREPEPQPAGVRRAPLGQRGPAAAGPLLGERVPAEQPPGGAVPLRRRARPVRFGSAGYDGGQPPAVARWPAPAERAAPRRDRRPR